MRNINPEHLFIDDHHTELCVYCGVTPATRDHIPSKVLLDKPYPSDLPVVPACTACNSSFSNDEQYVACLIECVVCGTTNPEMLRRENIKRILLQVPLLAAKIKECQTRARNTIEWNPELERVRSVALKLSRGHVYFDLSEPKLDDPEYVSITPICLMTKEKLQSFEALPAETMWPEIGGRAFIKSVEGPGYGGWNVVQTGRYRYAIVSSAQTLVRLVLSEYLLIEVCW